MVSRILSSLIIKIIYMNKKERWMVWLGGAFVGAIVMMIVDNIIYANFIITHFMK